MAQNKTLSAAGSVSASVDAVSAGFSPRVQALTLYVMAGFAGAEDLLARLGQFKTGKACLSLKSLADVDQAALAQLIARSVEHLRKTHRTAG
jgi:hypothetical protein